MEKMRPTKKPDLDNCLKAITDALNGFAYKDDSQIVSIAVSKFYSDDPRAYVKNRGGRVNRQQKRKIEREIQKLKSQRH